MKATQKLMQQQEREALHRQYLQDTTIAMYRRELFRITAIAPVYGILHESGNLEMKMKEPFLTQFNKLEQELKLYIETVYGSLINQPAQ